MREWGPTLKVIGLKSKSLSLLRAMLTNGTDKPKAKPAAKYLQPRCDMFTRSN